MKKGVYVQYGCGLSSPKEWINNLRQENKIEVNYESLYSIKEKPKN